jgi:hypothetical protein
MGVVQLVESGTYSDFYSPRDRELILSVFVPSQNQLTMPVKVDLSSSERFVHLSLEIQRTFMTALQRTLAFE